MVTSCTTNFNIQNLCTLQVPPYTLIADVPGNCPPSQDRIHCWVKEWYASFKCPRTRVRVNCNSHRLQWYIKNSPLVPHQLSICHQVRKPLAHCTVVQTLHHQDLALDAASVQAGYGNGPSLQAADVLLRFLCACSGETEQVNAFATSSTAPVKYCWKVSNELVQHKSSEQLPPNLSPEGANRLSFWESLRLECKCVTLHITIHPSSDRSTRHHLVLQRATLTFTVDMSS